MPGIIAAAIYCLPRWYLIVPSCFLFFVLVAEVCFLLKVVFRVVSKTVYLCVGSGFCMCFWKRLGLFMVCPGASFPEESSVVADYYDVLSVDAGLFSGDFSWLSCLFRLRVEVDSFFVLVVGKPHIPEIS